MRRLLAIVLAAGPLAAPALTPSAGQVLFNDSAQQFVINADACASSTQSVDLTWQVKPDVSFLDFGGTFNVYAASQDRAGTPYCWTDADPGTATVKVLKIGIAAPAALHSAKLTGPVSDLVGVTSQSGCASGSFTAYVCVQWLDSKGAVKGYAKGTAKVELDRPAAPAINTVGIGDTRLTVTIQPTSGTPAAATFSASATADPLVDPVVHTSSQVATDGTARIDGLKNGVEYMVTAFAYSAVGNRSAASIARGPYAPQPAADAWAVYKLSGGRDSGGCQAGGAGLIALLGAVGLLTLRRRS